MQVTIDDFQFGEVHVRRAVPQQPRATPLLFVHGGCHGSWCWEHFLGYFARLGWECYALDWYGHHPQSPIAADKLVTRSIADVCEEISIVCRSLRAPPVLVAHSMGSIAALKYTEGAAVAGLVLVTPGRPPDVPYDDLGFPIDMSRPWGPPPFEVSQQMFFYGFPEDRARHYQKMLVPESPRAVSEVGGGPSVPIDRVRISGPILVMAADCDALSPAPLVRRLADHYGAEYHITFGRGHSLMYDERWAESAEVIARWLQRNCPELPNIS